MKDPMVYITTMQRDGKYSAVRMKWNGDELGYQVARPYGDLVATQEQAISYAQDWSSKTGTPYIAADA
jgi:hypothetical protein